MIPGHAGGRRKEGANVAPGDLDAPRARLAPWEANPYRLVSLWDLVATFRATEAESLLSSVEFLGGEVRSSPPDVDRVVGELRSLLPRLRALSLWASSGLVESALNDIRVFGSENYESVDMPKRVAELGTLLRHELKSVVFVQLRPGRAYLYDAQCPFGGSVHEAFPSCRYDILEAAKCYAVERPTATVSHLMRCVETAIRLLARKFGVPSADREHKGAQSILDAATAALARRQAQTRQKKASKKREQELEFYGEVIVRLTGAKDAWRNAVSHARGIYTDDEAGTVFAAVEQLMQHLAKRLREPKAR
jgi:hypothetical protein